MVLYSALCSLLRQKTDFKSIVTVQSLILQHSTYLVVLGVQSVHNSLCFLGAAAVLYRTEAQGRYCRLSDTRTRDGQPDARAHLHICECCVWWWQKSWPGRCSIGGPLAQGRGSCQRPSRCRSAAPDASGSMSGRSAWETPTRTCQVRQESTEQSEPKQRAKPHLNICDPGFVQKFHFHLRVSWYLGTQRIWNTCDSAPLLLFLERLHAELTALARRLE